MKNEANKHKQEHDKTTIYNAFHGGLNNEHGRQIEENRRKEKKRE